MEIRTTRIMSLLLSIVMLLGMIPGVLLMPKQAVALPNAPDAIWNYPTRYDGWQPGDPVTTTLDNLDMAAPPSIINSFYDSDKYSSIPYAWAYTPATSRMWNGFSTPDHVVFDNDAVRFLGYGVDPFMDMVFYEDYLGGFDSISFTINPIIMNFHTFSESGLLFNGSFTGQYYSGYALLLKNSNTVGMINGGEAQLSLVYIDNELMNGYSYSPGTLATTRTLIGTYKTGIQTLSTQSFDIAIDKYPTGGGFMLYLDGRLVQDVPSSRSADDGFGFFTGYYAHSCTILTVMEFSQVAVTLGSNPPTETYPTVRFVDLHSKQEIVGGVIPPGFIEYGGFAYQEIANPQTEPVNPTLSNDPYNSYGGDLFRVTPPSIIDIYRYVNASRDILDPIRYRNLPANNEVVLFYASEIGISKSSRVGDIEGTGTIDNPIPVPVGSQFDYLIDIVNPGAERIPESGILSYGETIIQVSAGDGHSLALTDAGNLYAWGGNGFGQLGDGTTTNRVIPIAVDRGEMPIGETIIQIYAGYRHSLALTDAGNLYAWGPNWNGQLGDGTTTQRNTPVAVDRGVIPAGEIIVQISAGDSHSLALTDAGNLYAWGSNGQGQLGDNTTTERHTPVAVDRGEMSLGETIIQVVAGGSHSLALTDAGNLYAWGSNGQGRLGDGTTTSRYTPVAVLAGAISAGEIIIQATAGSNYSLALTDAGNLYAWGNNGSGQLGDGTTTNRHTPVAVDRGVIPAGETVIQVFAGSHYNVALTDAGNLYAWGDNGGGQLGDGTTTDRHTPVAVDRGEMLSSEIITQVFAGSAYGFALTDAGNLYAWGGNWVGQLGDGTSIQRDTPVWVSILSGPKLFALTDLIPEGLSLVLQSGEPIYTIVDGNGNAVDVGDVIVLVDDSSGRDEITILFEKLPHGTTRFSFKVSVDSPSNPLFINQASFYDPTTEETLLTNETFHATGASVTEKYQAWGTGVTLAEDTLRGFGPAFDDALGDGYSPWPFRLRPIMDSAGDMWRLVGYQRIGVDASPVLGHPPMGLQWDADEEIWVGDGWCWDSITQDEEIIFFFAKDIKITIDYKDVDDKAGPNIKGRFNTTVPGMQDYNMAVSHMDAFGIWNYAAAYSLDGGTTVINGVPPMPTFAASQMVTDQHIVLYFTQNPVVTVQYREYGADILRRQNSQMLFDANGVNRETFTLSGSSPYTFDPMAQSTVSNTVNNGATSFIGYAYPVYRGWSDDGGVTINSGAPPEFTGITETKHIILYFTTQYTVIEKFQANDATHGAPGTTLKADVLTQVWGGDPFAGDAPHPTFNALGSDGIAYTWHYIGWVMDKPAPDFTGVAVADYATLVDGVTPPTIAQINASGTTIIYIYYKGDALPRLTITERFREYQNTGNILSADVSFLVDWGSAYTGNPKDLAAKGWYYVGYQIDGGPVVKDKLPLGILINSVEQAYTITYLYSKVPPPPPTDEFVKLPKNQTVRAGELVNFGISGFGNKHAGPATKYRITDYPPQGTDLVSISIPAFTKGEGLTYSILGNTNKNSSVVYATGIAADSAYTFNAPILPTGEHLTAIAIYFESVPAGFGVGDQILYTFRVSHDAAGKTLVNRAVIDYVYDGSSYDSESKANVKVIAGGSPSTADGTVFWTSFALLVLSTCIILVARKRREMHYMK